MELFLRVGRTSGLSYDSGLLYEGMETKHISPGPCTISDILDTEDSLVFTTAFSQEMPWGKLGENSKKGFVITLRKYPRVMTSCPVGNKKA